jgi:hypothetical protein
MVRALIIYGEGRERKKTAQCNAVPVKLPLYAYKLYLVVIKGY